MSTKPTIMKRLNWICSTASRQELEDRYDKWAPSYDENVVPDWNVAPQTAAEFFAGHVGHRDCRILDAGAGTGLVGQALYDHGFHNLVAVDLSGRMLEQARQKDVYRELFKGRLDDPYLFEPECFDAVVSVGVFAEAHAGQAEAANLLRFVRPGGIVLFSARSDYGRAFWPEIEGMPVTPVASMEVAVFDSNILELRVMVRDSPG